MGTAITHASFEIYAHVFVRQSNFSVDPHLLKLNILDSALT